MASEEKSIDNVDASSTSVTSPRNPDAKSSDGHQEHSFLVNPTYFEDMEERLLKLLDTFKRGGLTAFGKYTKYKFCIMIKQLQ